MAFMFEKLEVYQKAVNLDDQVVVVAGTFPRGFGFLADQLELLFQLQPIWPKETRGLRNPIAGISSRLPEVQFRSPRRFWRLHAQSFPLPRVFDLQLPHMTIQPLDHLKQRVERTRLIRNVLLQPPNIHPLSL